MSSESATSTELATVPTNGDRTKEATNEHETDGTSHEHENSVENSHDNSDDLTPNLSLSSITDGQNARGIPKVWFVEDIGQFMEQFTPPASAELLIGAFTDLFGKYKAYETNLSQKRLRIQQKVPDMETSLELVQFLQSKQQLMDKDKDNDDDDDDAMELTARYPLADTLYAKAQVECNGIVHLWLGANVMLEYTYDEAIALLSSKLAAAQRELQEVTEDLAFTRNQIITAEVNISRIYNHDVRKRRDTKR